MSNIRPWAARQPTLRLAILANLESRVLVKYRRWLCVICLLVYNVVLQLHNIEAMNCGLTASRIISPDTVLHPQTRSHQNFIAFSYCFA